MKYLTKEWYELCQRTWLHFDMKVNDGAAVYDEALYLRLYRRKEKEFVKIQREIYDADPRIALEQDGCMITPFYIFANGEEIDEEDKIVYHMPSDEREHILRLIEEYDVRPPFDVLKCREEFRSIQETVKIREAEEKIPHELLQQIADMRVFSLGYCTKEVLKQLKRYSNENEKKMKHVLSENSEARMAESIPESIKENFGFHDCRVIEFTIDKNKNIVIRLDTRGGFTDLNKITFVSPDIIKQEEHIMGSVWLYEELYRRDNGYEAHMLFTGEEMLDLIISCEDIVIDKE